MLATINPASDSIDYKRCFLSQFLLVGFSDENGAICLATFEPHAPNGKKMH